MVQVGAVIVSLPRPRFYQHRQMFWVYHDAERVRCNTGYDSRIEDDKTELLALNVVVRM
jgi:hypothetical protein